MLSRRDAHLSYAEAARLCRLALFDTEITQYIPPRGAATHLRAIMSALESATPGQETELSGLFHELAKRIVRRGLVIVISDLLDEPSQVISALKHLRHQKHEVIVSTCLILPSSPSLIRVLLSFGTWKPDRPFQRRQIP